MERETDWARVARWAVAVAIEAFSMSTILDKTWAGAALVFVISVSMFWVLKRKAEREQERRINTAELRGSIGQ